jgi:hypothetical protein
MIGKHLASMLILIMIVMPVSSGYSITFGQKNKSLYETPAAHTIKEVPYVGQETSFFCAYACFTMFLNNYKNINTSLEDVLYFTGVGYSLIYPHYALKRMPMGGFGLCQYTKDIDFLTSLFGLSYALWAADTNSSSDEKCWRDYQLRVEENISSDVPVMTGVYPSKLSSFRKLMNLPNFLWDLMPSFNHAVVIVGYNNSNGTICYNDPASALFGHPEYGTYAWMNISEFKEAVIKTGRSRYIIITFNKISEPLTKKEAFNLSNVRNIEKLRGNISLYDDDIINLSKDSKFGIFASKLLENDLEKGVHNRTETIAIYESRGKLGIRYRFLKNIAPRIAELFRLPSDAVEAFTIDEYRRIAIEKNYTARFLYRNSNMSNICRYEAMLFENESMYWNELSSNYSIFMKKGIFLSLPRTISIVNRMHYSVFKIIEIEDAINQI